MCPLRTYILIGFFTLFQNIALGQENNEDDIYSQHFVDSLNKVSLNISYDSPDSALKLMRFAINVSRKIDYNYGAYKSFEITASTYRVLGNYDSAKYLLDSLLQKSVVAGDSALMATSLYQKAHILTDLGEFEQGLKVLQRVVKIQLAIDDQKELDYTYNLMGNTYANMGYYDQAIGIYQKALKINQTLGNREELAGRYNNIARVYTFTEEYQKALKNYQKAYDLAVLTDSEAAQAIYSNNLAYLLKIQGRYNEALIFLYKALNIHESRNAYCGKMYPMYNIGSIYVETGNLDSAAYYLNLVLPQTLVCEGDQYLRCLILTDLGKMYIKKGDFDNGKDYLLESFNNAQKYRLPAQALSASKLLSEVYESMGNTGESLKFFRQYHALYDSLNNSEHTRRITRIEAQYEYEQQRQQDSLKQKVKRLESEQELANAIWVRNSLIVGFIFLGVITFMILINYNRKNKANAKLSELNQQIMLQKNELEHQAEELRSANEEITRINENLEQIVNARTAEVKEQNKKIVEYVYYNSHKVRGPLARILGLVDLFQRNGISTEEIQDKLSELKKEAVELDAMVRQMNRSLEKQKKSLNG